MRLGYTSGPGWKRVTRAGHKVLLPKKQLKDYIQTASFLKYTITGDGALTHLFMLNGLKDNI